MFCFEPSFARCAPRARLAPFRRGGSARVFALKVDETNTPSPLSCLIFAANTVAIRNSGETRASHFVSSESHATRTKAERSGKLPLLAPRTKPDRTGHFSPMPKDLAISLV